MNRYAASAECLHGVHGQCDYEDCACLCHAAEILHSDFDNDHDRDQGPAMEPAYLRNEDA